MFDVLKVICATFANVLYVAFITLADSAIKFV